MIQRQPLQQQAHKRWLPECNLLQQIRAANNYGFLLMEIGG